ncbi:MAG TPA: polysaccharide biosynthesis C-terminal domain-containing protein [Gaiellaceae bacterium]|nr:polysaccharide biosynthesis C-terminal domain-containing protein [Gaiellaceae bacterium]
MTEVRVAPVEAAERGDRPQGVSALARDALIYGSTRVLVKSLAFILVPVYAHFLAPSAFGVLELVLATIAFVDVLITANMDGVLARFYFEKTEPAWRRQVITLYLAIEAAYPALLVGGFILFAGPLSEGIVGEAGYAALFVIALVDVYLSNVVDLPLILCRVRRKPVTFAAYTLTRGLVQVVLTVLLVAVWHLGVKGILIASLAAVCVAFVVTLREYVRDLTRRIEWKVGREMVAFAWPGIIGGLAFYGLNLVDRFFVTHYHGLADNGLYGAAFRFSQVVLVAVFAFRLGWTQWHYSWLHSGHHERMVARGANYYFFATGFLTVALAAWILPVFHLLMPERYWPATPAVAPLAIAAMAAGAYTIFAVGFNVTKRMRRIPPLTMTAAAIAIGLYFLLIPPFSFVGAAWATATAFAGLVVLVWIFSRRLYPVPWDWRRIGLAVGLTAGLALASLAADEWLDFEVSLPLRFAITAAYPLGLVALGFFPPADLARIRALRPGRLLSP